MLNWYFTNGNLNTEFEQWRRGFVARSRELGKRGEMPGLRRAFRLNWRYGKAGRLADRIGKGDRIFTVRGRAGMVEQNPSFGDGTLERLQAAQTDIRDEYLAEHSIPWIVGYSGGKDSTLLAQLVFEMLLDLAPSDRKRPVHILCNDTLVESPVLMAYIDRMLARLQTAAESLHLPITVVKTTPALDQGRFQVELR
jgi:hypothetical protein